MKQSILGILTLSLVSLLSLGSANAAGGVDCTGEEVQSSSAHFLLSAGGSNPPGSYGHLDLKLTYEYCESGIAKMFVGVDKKNSKNEDKFTRNFSVQYFGGALKESDYEPEDAHEAYLLIKWSYFDNSRSPETNFASNADEYDGKYYDRDSGTSVIRIDTSLDGKPETEVERAGGSWLYNANRSGLTKTNED